MSRSNMSFKLFSNLGSFRLIEHVMGVIDNEPESTRIYLRAIQNATRVMLYLVLINEEEGVHEGFYFFMDEVDLKQGTYSWYQIPISAAKDLISISGQ